MQEKGKVSIDYMSALTDKSADEIIKELEFDKIFYDFFEQEYQLAEEYLSGDVRQKIDDLQQMLDNQKFDFEANITASVLNLRGFSDYQPKNDIEQQILNANPESSAWFDFSRNPDFENYILEHQDDFDFISQIAKLQGSRYIHLNGNSLDHTSKVGQLIMQRPLAILEAIHHLGKDSTFPEYIVNHFRAIGEDDVLYGGETSWEHKELVFAFMRQKLAPFEYNPELIKPANASYYLSDYSEAEVREKLQQEWHDFQEKFQRDKKSAIDNFDFDNAPLHNRQLLESRLHIQKNIEALEKVKPKDLSAADIHVELGAAWIPTSDIEQFLRDTFDIQSSQFTVNYTELTSAWEIQGKKYANGPKAEITFGVEGGVNALVIAENVLNGKQTNIYKDAYIDGEKKRVPDDEKTIIAQQKAELINQEFQKWIFADEERRNRLVAYYNRHFNNLRPREYDGSHLTFPKMNPKIQLREHQKNAIAHTLYGGNTLLAHSVGAGKTFEMVASAMEAKRIGLCQKSLFVVPNHLTEQFGKEFLQLYPNAKILVVTKDDFGAGNRKEFCSKIAAQNWDAVIIGHSQLTQIPISKERQEKLLEKQKYELLYGIEELRNSDDKGNRFTIKQAEAVLKKIKNKLDKLHEDNKTDYTVTFEQLGVDRLFVDEAHYFKNLYTFTKMGNIPGVSTSHSNKATDLFDKCQYMREQSNGKCSIIFATATPISNSMTELYTMQRYLNPDSLKKEGFGTFDAWASTFAKKENVFELAPSGKGFQNKIRFSKFYNLPELMSMFKEVADIKTADELNLATPNAEFVIEKIQPSDYQKDIVDSLADRAERIHNTHVDPKVDNMLKITNDGRKLALDQRLIDPELPDDENSKVNVCLNKVFEIYQETTDKKSTQLIFCDQSTPSGKGKDAFNVYDDFKQKLVAKGVPADEIVFIHDAGDDDQKKLELFEKVRKGEVRILLGSTPKLGVGTNIQDRLIAMHDLDVPWRPSDLEQRAGRIIRQGNENDNVKVFRYVTEGTFDSYLWQIIENKQRFISQVMTSKNPARSVDDVDETTLAYSEIKAIAAGNPLIKEKMEVDNKLSRLRTARRDFFKSHEKL